MRRECLAGVAIGLPMLLLSACSRMSMPVVQAAALKPADEKAIREAEFALASDWNSRDLDKILSHFADNATVTLPDTWPAKGKDAFRAALTEFLMDKDLSLNLTPSDETTGNLLREGTYVLTRNNSRTMASTTQKGIYMVIFGKLANGRWTVVHHGIGSPPQLSPDPLPHMVLGSLFYHEGPA